MDLSPRGGRRWKTWHVVAVGGGTLLTGVVIGAVGRQESGTQVAARLPTTAPPLRTTVSLAPSTTARPVTTVAAPTTTPLPPLPAGDDTTVVRVVDGDSLVVAGGTSIRLIGVDAPESGDCFSAEATDHLGNLAGPGTRVRLVYDAQRIDRYGRTLAYVYRLPDGLFVNLALARDGFVWQLDIAPNSARAGDLGTAVAQARGAGRGLWASCRTTTTAAPALRAQTPAPSPSPAPAAGANCSAAYPDFCIPPPPPDLDCPDVGRKRFTVLSPDPHRFDADRDGIGCET